MLTLVGTLGHDTRATVDTTGGVDVGRWRLGWWVGADDRWRFPAEEVSLRQSLVDEMPVVRTALRVPSGDAVQHVFGAPGGSVVVEVENASPAAFALALVISGARHVELDGSTVVVDGKPGLRTPRSPRRWAARVGGSVRDAVVRGAAAQGELAPVRDRRGRVEVAFLYPVAHRSTLRVTLLPGEGAEYGAPSAHEVAKGWLAQLERGMRVELPDERLRAAVARSRAQAVLAAGMHSDAVLLGALEDWGLDDEAALAWARASLLDRRRARRRVVRRLMHPARFPGSMPRTSRSPARVLATVHDLLVREGTGGVEVLRALPETWRGSSLEVRDAPLRAGALSYAVRWHGARPALLWEIPEGTTLRAPGLDPTWSTTEPSGEALLAART